LFAVVSEQTEFRFFWLQTKLQETPDVLSTSNINPVSVTWLLTCLLARLYFGPEGGQSISVDL